MNKIIKYIAVFFFATTLIFAFMNNYADLKADKLESEKTALKKENTELKKENKNYLVKLEKIYNDKVELNRKYKELEESAKSDKNFDWFVDISNSDVIKQLRD